MAEERRHLKKEEERSIEGGYGGGAEALLPLPGEVAGAPDHPVRHLTTRSTRDKHQEIVRKNTLIATCCKVCRSMSPPAHQPHLDALPGLVRHVVGPGDQRPGRPPGHQPSQPSHHTILSEISTSIQVPMSTAKSESYQEFNEVTRRTVQSDVYLGEIQDKTREDKCLTTLREV